MKLGGEIGFQLLSKITSLRLGAAGPAFRRDGIPADFIERGQNRLCEVFGDDIIHRCRGMRVVGYGCGKGMQATALACSDVNYVIGVDVNDSYLEVGRRLVKQAGASKKCLFMHAVDDQTELSHSNGTIEIIYSIDAFEHFVDVPHVLSRMYSLLAPGGRVLISFGPPWKHPRGMHMSYLRPLVWTHLVFSERAVMRVRNEYRRDGKMRYAEASLGRLTVGEFRHYALASRFTIESFNAVPIRRCKVMASFPVLREYFTSVVRCQLVKSK